MFNRRNGKDSALDSPQGQDVPGQVKVTLPSQTEVAETLSVDRDQPSSAPGKMEVKFEPLGLSDLAAKDDALEVRDHREGLSEFLARCSTPMTVAVQGEWGSGKTSLLNFVAEDLKADPRVAKTIEFNTWEVAFVDSGPLMTMALMQQILDAIEVKGQEDNRKQILSAMAKVTLTRGLKFAPLFTKLFVPGGAAFEGAVEEVTDAAVKKLNEQPDEEPMELPAQVLTLRRLFAQQVSSYLAGHEGTRIVVLIDDLDRLEPARAVDLLESLKSIMDCVGCVFVLAVDFEVVVEGVKAKYLDISEEKGRSFFDKLVQVPFRMPSTSQPQIRKIVDNALPGERAENLEFYTRVCWLGSGGNPRTVKRILNSFILMSGVGTRFLLGADNSDADAKSAPTKKRLLFCLQALHEAMPDKSSQLMGDAAAIKASAQRIREDKKLGGGDPGARVRMEALLDEVSQLSGQLSGEEIGRITQLASATTVASSSQNHTINADVQAVMRRLFERLAISGEDDEPAPAGDPRAVARFDTSRVTVSGLTIAYVRRTQGKGQGLHFYIRREEEGPFSVNDFDPSGKRIYISGDSAGRIPNDGFGMGGTKIKSHKLKNGAYNATELVKDSGLFDEFEASVVSELNELLRRYAETQKAQ